MKKRKMKYETTAIETLAMRRARIKREKECVKAMDGIDDPIEFMEYHKKVLEAFNQLHKELNKLKNKL